MNDQPLATEKAANEPQSESEKPSSETSEKPEHSSLTKSPDKKKLLLLFGIGLLFLIFTSAIYYRGTQKMKKTIQPKPYPIEAKPTTIPSPVLISCQTDGDCPQPMCIPGEEICTPTGCSTCTPIGCIDDKCQPNYSAITANWKTYRNEEFGFEVKYPADIYEPLLDTEIYYEFRNREIPRIAILSFYALEGSGWSAANISIVSATAEQYINALRESSDGSFERIEEKAVLNGVPVTKIFYRNVSKNEIWYLDMLIEHNGKLYVLDRDVGEEEWEVHAEQILSTFKFLDQQAFTCPDITFVSCIPEGIDPNTAKYCTPKYASWIQDNCPGVLVVY